MGTIADLMPVGKYENLPKSFSGNLVTSDYRTTTANLKKFDIFLPKPVAVDVGSTHYGIVPPILLPAGLTKEELLGARIFFYEDVFSQAADTGELIPNVTMCYSINHFSPELPNLYYLEAPLNNYDPMYDSETGVLLVREEVYMQVLLGKQNFQPEDYTQAFTMIRDALIGNVPRINAEITDEDANIHATITFSVPAREFYNAGCCLVTYSRGDDQPVVADKFTVALLSGGTRKVHLDPVELCIQSPDNPIVKIIAGSADITLVQIDDEGKVFSTEAP